MLAKLLTRRCFSKVPQSAVARHQAQLAYLRHIQKRRIKKRPTLVRHSEGQTVRRDGLSPVVAGGACFNKAVETQTESVHINGILAAFRAKAWVLARGWDVSLGTVGTERLWRNLQRMARNKGRSRASLSTVNLVLLMRWCREVQSRLFAGGGAWKAPWSRLRIRADNHARTCGRVFARASGRLVWSVTKRSSGFRHF